MKSMKQKLKTPKVSRWAYFAAGIVLGILVILAVRFFTYNPRLDHTHYHANFAVYVNGQREEFKNPQYYQEVAACSAAAANNPKSRAHMHDDINDVIHVHDKAVTWAQFFENLGWSFSATSLINKDGQVYSQNDGQKLHLILNGQDYTDLGGLATTVIQDKDRLLISYGSENTATVMKQFKTVANTAARVDQQPDPASCGGAEHESPTVSERLRNLF